MKILRGWNLFLIVILTAMIVYACTALADDINPDADVPDISTLTDSKPDSQVLEIPQQCDQNSGAIPCNRNVSDSPSSLDDAYANAGNDGASDLVDNPEVGSVYDYSNQNYTNEALAEGAVNVPMGVYAPGYPGLSPAPTIVSSSPVGPGSYQQWASGPGTFQQTVRGPGFISAQQLGYRPYGFASSFGRPSFGNFGGGRFGRR